MQQRHRATPTGEKPDKDVNVTRSERLRQESSFSPACAPAPNRFSMPREIRTRSTVMH